MSLTPIRSLVSSAVFLPLSSFFPRGSRRSCCCCCCGLSLLITSRTRELSFVFVFVFSVTRYSLLDISTLVFTQEDWTKGTEGERNEIGIWMTKKTDTNNRRQASHTTVMILGLALPRLGLCGGI